MVDGGPMTPRKLQSLRISEAPFAGITEAEGALCFMGLLESARVHCLPTEDVARKEAKEIFAVVSWGGGEREGGKEFLVSSAKLTAR